MAWLTGWTYREALTFNSNGVGLGGNLTDKTVRVNMPSSDTDFWANVKADGTDVRFTSDDGSTLLKFEIESFDNTGDDAWYHVKIPTLTSATDTVIYIYYGNAGASSGEDITNTWDSSYKGVWHLNEDSAAGAFADSTSNNNDGTNNSTTTATGQIDKGRNVSMVTPTDISIADSDTLTFASGGVDTAMTITAWVKMTDATRFRIFSKGSVANPEYHFVVSGADTLGFQLNGSGGTISATSTGTLTADEGSWVYLAVTYDGSEVNTGITNYRNATVFTSTPSGSGTYTGMQNTALSAYIASYYDTGSEATGSGVIDEVTISAANRSADWLIADYQSGLGTWLTVGAQETEATSYSYTAVGGAIAGGTADYIRITSHVASGGAISGGDATYLRLMFYTSDGGGIVGGNADYTFNGAGQFEMTGGAIAGGSADYTRVALFAATGGAIVGGTAPYSFTIASNVQEIIWELYNATTGDPITGASGSTTIKFRRTPDGKIYDWADDTFKSSGWTSITSTLSEKDATNLPGLYVKEIDVALLVDGRYQIFVGYTASNPKQRGSIEFLIKDGAVWDVHTSDNVDVTTSSRPTLAEMLAGGVAKEATLATAQADITSILNYAIAMSKWKNNRLARTVAGTTETWVLYDDDSTTPMLTWTNNISTRVRTKAT